MKVLFGYYFATDDQDARRAVSQADGQLNRDGHDQVFVEGIDPVVDLPWVEFVLTGRSSRVIRSDPQHGRVVVTVGDGEMVNVSITDTFRDALASADREFLDDIASNWRLSGSYSPPPDAPQLAGFLKQLASLAERAVAQGCRLYCWKRLQ